MTETTQKYIVAPLTVIIDTREQSPYHFTGFNADARDAGKALLIPTKTATLDSGDYSIESYEHAIAVERKSLVDLYRTLSAGRDRFERELERLNVMKFAAVVVEGSLLTVLTKPPPKSRMSPKSIYRSIIAYSIRYPRVHWFPCDTRVLAEHTTFRILERFWKDEQEKQKELQNVTGRQSE